MRALSTLWLLWAGCPSNEADGPGDGGTTDSGTSPTVTTPDAACADNPGGTVCDGNDLVTCDVEGNVASTEPCTFATTCEGGVCVACEPSSYAVPGADPAIVTSRGLRVDIDTDPNVLERIPYLRPVEMLVPSTVAVTGPLELFDPTGAPVVNGATVSGPIWLRGSGFGDASLAIDDGVCAATLAVTTDLPRSLAGRPLDAFPWFETPDLYVAEDDAVWLLVDPSSYFDRAGQPFDAYIVEPRTPAEWAANPTILPVVGPIFGEVSTSGAVPIELWSTPDPGDLVASYTMILDFDRNGRLDPGDLVDGYDQPGFTVAGDFSAPGPYTERREEVSFDFWHTFLVYWPDEVALLDPIPLVVISHGNGHDYTWYDYLGYHFASHGYAVIVHRNDTADTSIIPAANTTWQNTDLFLLNLATEVGGALDGEIDSHRIAFIGHSRGGEGVVIAYNGIQNGQIVPEAFTAKDVRVVSSIAPTVWTSPETADPSDVIYHQLDGSSDGDVTGAVDNAITQYFRIFQGSTNLRALTYVQGATHNDFNCCGFNDGAGVDGPKIGRPAAQHIAQTYYLALLRAVFDGDDVMWEYFNRNPEKFRPAGVETPVTTMLERADGDRVLVLDDFQGNDDLAVASSGAAVASSVENPAEGAFDDGDELLSASQADPFNGMSWVFSGDTRPDRGLVFEWADGSDLSWEVAIPATEQDWRDDGFVSFRVAQATRHPYTVALADLLSFTVELQDADGNVSPIDFRVYGGVNQPYQRDGLGVGTGWVNEFQTVRIPVSAFAADGTVLDLSRVAALRFRFGAEYGAAQGRVGIDDIELLQEVLP